MVLDLKNITNNVVQVNINIDILVANQSKNINQSLKKNDLIHELYQNYIYIFWQIFNEMKF